MRRSMFLALAVVVVAFAATWLTIPSTYANVAPPARIFAVGLGGPPCEKWSDLKQGLTCVRTGRGKELSIYEIHTLKSRVLVGYGSLAAVVLLVGLALRRRPTGAPARA